MAFIEPFSLELYFAKHEFSAKYLLCCSDAESISMKDLLSMADEECLAQWENLKLGYTETRGSPILRSEILKTYPGLNLENILCFAGAEEGVFCCLRTMLLKEDHCVVITPCYQSLKSIPDSICSVTTVDMIESEGWQLNLQSVQEAICENTKMIVINFPHNPTGALLTRLELESLIEIARARDIWLFSDEVYRGLEVDESLRLPPVASIYEKGLSLGVLSKSLGLAGLRIGWIACQSLDCIEEIAATKHYLSICNSAPSEILGLIALRNEESIRRRNRDILLENLRQIDLFLVDWGHVFQWVKPKGGCCGFMHFIGTGTATSITLNQLAELLVTKYGVLLLPGDNFPTAGSDVSNNFRFGFGRLNFKENLEVLKAALRDIGLQPSSDL